VSAVKGALEGGFSFGAFNARSYTVFEANVPFPLRFMIDAGVTGCNWCEAPAGAWASRPAGRRRTSAQIELDIVHDQVRARRGRSARAFSRAQRAPLPRSFPPPPSLRAARLARARRRVAEGGAAAHPEL
jgi:hypothetical protein